jgi:hypothetical protein
LRGWWRRRRCSTYEEELYCRLTEAEELEQICRR